MTNSHSEVGARVSGEEDPGSGWRVFVNLSNLAWWKNTFAASMLFSPCCVWPAGLCTLAILCARLGSMLAFSRLSSLKIIDNWLELAGALGILLFTLAVTLILLVWGMGLWLFRVTAFCRAFLALPYAALIDRDLGTACIKDAQKTALLEISRHKAHIGKLWFFVTLSMALPLCVVMIAGIIKLFAILSYLPIVLPSWFDPCAVSIGSILGLLSLCFPSLRLSYQPNSICRH